MDALAPALPYKMISADSHVTEPPDMWTRFCERKYHDIVPRIGTDKDRGATYYLHGVEQGVPIALAAAAGREPADMVEKRKFLTFAEMHRGGWDAKARMADQDLDGVGGEIVFPTVGMGLCRHPDPDYRATFMWAYNRWLQEEFVAAAPDRVFGIGVTAVRSVAESIEDLRRFKEMGFRGAMLPGTPATAEDYDHASFDPLWRAAAELGLPVCFHILTDKADFGKPRGPTLAWWSMIVRTVQDIIGMFIFGGVFERHPGLRLVCVEGDAGWVPHYMYRMDHMYKQHRLWHKGVELSRLPSEYFRDNVYLTFQDDYTAFQSRDLMNVNRLLWANDFPHSDATWPHSQAVVAEQTRHIPEEQKRRILRDNVAELYGLPVQ